METSTKLAEELEMDAPKEIFLNDYKQPDYYFNTVELKFLLDEEKTLVFSEVSVIPRVEGSASPLILNGEDLKLISLKVNGRELKVPDIDQYKPLTTSLLLHLHSLNALLLLAFLVVCWMVAQLLLLSSYLYCVVKHSLRTTKTDET